MDMQIIRLFSISFLSKYKLYTRCVKIPKSYECFEIRNSICIKLLSKNKKQR